MSRRIEKCRACAGTGQIIVDNWLTEGRSPEELKKEAEEAIRTAEIELRNKQIKEFENKGYRKASEVAEEIFAEIENKLQANMSGEFRGDSIEWFDYFDLHLAEDIAELKNKYTESEDSE